MYRPKLNSPNSWVSIAKKRFSKIEREVAFSALPFDFWKTSFCNRIPRIWRVQPGRVDNLKKLNTIPRYKIQPKNDQFRQKWTQNISDLDSFFTRVYEFHQQHGLLCMFLQSAFDISQYIFIIWFTTELRHCVDYDMLFSNGNFTEERRYVLEHPLSGHPKISTFFSFATLDIVWPCKSLKMSFSLLDGFKSRSECHSAIRGDGMWCLFLIFASVFGAIKAFKLGNRILQFMDIKNFYHEALGISSGTFSWYLIGWYVYCNRPIRIASKTIFRKIRPSQLDSNSIKVARSAKIKSNVYS